MSYLNEFDRPLTTDWIQIGECEREGPPEYYRKIELYDMGWTVQKIDIENYAVEGASYGGPVAIIKDDKKFLRVTPQIPAKPIISIFTAAGHLVSSIKVKARENKALNNYQQITNTYYVHSTSVYSSSN